MENDAWMIPALWMARYSSIRSDMRMVAQMLKAVMSVENMAGTVCSWCWDFQAQAWCSQPIRGGFVCVDQELHTSRGEISYKWLGVRKGRERCRD